VEPLKPPESFFVSAAEGWLELGNVSEAEAELAQVSKELGQHPDVLEVRWAIAAHGEQWEEGLELARELVQVAPKRPSGWLHQAYALRRVQGGGLQEAWDALLPAVERFKREPIIFYNLSCYACQMGDLETARSWLRRAILAGGKERMLRLARSDTDLESLWPELDGL